MDPESLFAVPWPKRHQGFRTAVKRPGVCGYMMNQKESSRIMEAYEPELLDDNYLTTSLEWDLFCITRKV